MYTGISKIIFDRKLDIKLRAFVKLLNKLGCRIHSKKIVYILYFMLKVLFAFAGGLGLFLLLDQEYLTIAIGALFLLGIILKGIDGCAEYKHTFHFPFRKLGTLSVATDRKIYRTQLAVAAVYSICLDELVLASIIFLSATVLSGGASFVVLINFAVCITAAFLLGNFLMGTYTYAIVVRKISLIRLLVYIAWATILVLVAFGVTDWGVRMVRDEFLNKITDVQMLFDDAFVKTLFAGYGEDISRAFLQVGKWMADCAVRCARPEFGLACLLGTGVLLLLPVRMIPTEEENRTFSGGDMYAMYRKFLQKAAGGNILVQSQVKDFSRYRWLFVKGFFQVVFLQYESICYIAILVALIKNTDDPMMILQLLVCMNLLALANQASELRGTGYAYFSLATEGAHIRLLKTSLAKRDAIWLAKEKVFKCFLWIPSLLLLFLNIGICQYMQMPGYVMAVAVGSLLLSAFVMPLIQLHVIPIVTNVEYLSEAQVGESLMEEEVAGKMQEFPRIFLVVVPTILAIAMLLVGKEMKLLLLACECAYLLVSAAVLCIYMKKIRDKGVENTVKKIH